MRIALQQPAQTAPAPVSRNAHAADGRKNKPTAPKKPAMSAKPALPVAAPQAQRDPAERSEAAPPVTLSKRELEIMRYIAQGQTAQEVANVLFISKRTVDFHVGNVYDKCSVSNRTQAVLFLIQNGILRVDGLKVCGKASKKQTGAKNKQEAGK